MIITKFPLIINTMKMYSSQYARYVQIVFLASFTNPGKILQVCPSQPSNSRTRTT